MIIKLQLHLPGANELRVNGQWPDVYIWLPSGQWVIAIIRLLLIIMWHTLRLSGSLSFRNEVLLHLIQLGVVTVHCNIVNSVQYY